MGKAWLSANIVRVAGTAAVLCGLLFLALTGAPPRLLLINLVALGVGLAVVAIARLLPRPTPAVRDALTLSMAAALLATALLGTEAEGATRWIAIGSLSLQPSLILVPALLFAHVGAPGRWTSLAIALAALAVALQPDRSVAAALAAVTLVDAVLRRTRGAWLTAIAPLAAFAATLGQPDLLPAVAHVDQILWTPLRAEPLAAIAIWTGTLLLFLPAVSLWRRAHILPAVAFTALWAVLVLSAAVGNYPTPLVGYGASCILGYLLAALALPDASRSGAAAQAQSGDPVGSGDPPASWRLAPVRS
jgi:hypothetical protein